MIGNNNFRVYTTFGKNTVSMQNARVAHELLLEMDLPSNVIIPKSIPKRPSLIIKINEKKYFDEFVIIFPADPIFGKYECSLSKNEEKVSLPELGYTNENKFNYFPNLLSEIKRIAEFQES
jgi:hypothetical protein